ncbi:MAG: aldehyde dehydrogenase family protein [Armatimonadota bacterium]|nr:aldehyde dehydrogenase family protein [Armatimonadota bacterium]MDR5696486.1 aldehyde dehydrogenase family protein [Armatimonadota bacterium]
MTPRVPDILQTMEYGPAPESAEPALRWLDARGRRFTLFVANRWVEPTGGEFFESLDPATGRPLAQVAQASAEDVDAAVRAAAEAFQTWGRTPGHVRARYLYAIGRQVLKHARLLAVLESLDNGKPIRETRDIDIPLVARHFYHHAGWAQLAERTFPGHEAVGVVGQIIPWNFPLLMLAWKIAPALAAGNTVVLKPAEFTSVSAMAFCEILLEIGLPPGVVNVVTGDGRVGEMIVRHPGVQKIAFTGSTEVGRIIRRATAGTGKRVSLELGGKSPFVVFDDADLDSVVEGVVDAIWFNQGQVCCAGSRLLVQENVADLLTTKLRARMETLRVGDPLDKAIDIGAIIAPVQLQKIRTLCEIGVREGARMWQPSWAVPRDGFFFPPTLFTDVAPSATIAQVEIFGPVLVSMTFRTPAEAVALANNTRYGLAASVWTENINLALDVARKIKAGTVWINSTNLFDAASGFGGYRESGFGREGGREGMWEYLKPSWQAGAASVRQAEPPPVRGAEVQVGSAPDFVRPLTADGTGMTDGPPPIDRSPKMYIGGRQTRPDAPYGRRVYAPDGRVVGEVGEGNRKDIRNAVEAARAVEAWGLTTGHARAQILYYVAENLQSRAAEFVQRIAQMTGDPEAARVEVAATIERLFSYAAWADKYDGWVHHVNVPHRDLTIAIPEPVGVVGIACPDPYPLLAFVSLVAPAIAMGNTVVAIPSQDHPLAATDFYQVLDTSDVPGGVVNIVTGERDALTKVLAQHDDVDAVWYFGTPEGGKMVEYESATNIKRTWVDWYGVRDWLDPLQGEGEEFLRHATQVKNIWVPYGE